MEKRGGTRRTAEEEGMVNRKRKGNDRPMKMSLSLEVLSKERTTNYKNDTEQTSQTFWFVTN